MLNKLLLITLLSVLLSAINLGSIWQQIQPFWILVFYFILLTRYSIPAPLYIAIVLGAIIDITSSAIIGQTSLALVIASYITAINYKQIKFANIITRAVYLLIISYIYLLVLFIPQIINNSVVFNYLVLIAPIVSVIFYIIVISALPTRYNNE